jgi:ABC-type glycerol-3-phosphate transport system substrate-binding protein
MRYRTARWGKLVGLAAVVGILLLAALVPAALGQQTVTITMWQHSYPPLNTWTKGQIAAFQKQNPDIKVNYVLVPFEEFNQKILTALATGSGPEVFESDDYTFAQFKDNNSLAPLNPQLLGLRNVRALTAAYEPNALGLVTFGGRVYGLPYDWEAPVIGYNIRLLRQAGVNPRTLTTWPRVMQAAQKLSKTDGNNLVQSGFAFVHNIDVYYQLQGTTLLRQAGVDVVSADGRRATLNTPKALKVFELWRDAVHRYKATQPGFTSTFYTEEFGKNRVGMGFMLAWANSILAPYNFKNGRDFDVLPIATFPGAPRTSASYAWNWVINARAEGEKAEAAHKLLAFLSTKGASELRQAGLINPRKGWRQSVSRKLRSDYQEIFQSLASSKPIRPMAKFNEVWKPVIDLFKAVEQDPNVNIRARIAQANAEINEVVGTS